MSHGPAPARRLTHCREPVTTGENTSILRRLLKKDYQASTPIYPVGRVETMVGSHCWGDVGHTNGLVARLGVENLEEGRCRAGAGAGVGMGEVKRT